MSPTSTSGFGGFGFRDASGFWLLWEGFARPSCRGRVGFRVLGFGTGSRLGRDVWDLRASDSKG